MPEAQRTTLHMYNHKRSMVVWLRDWPRDQKVAGSIADSTNFLANSSGQATNALLSLFNKQSRLVPAS